MYYDPTKNIVFKENHLGEWVNKEGYTILEKPSDIENWKEYRLISPTGEQVSGPFTSESILQYEGRYVRIISLLSSKGRDVGKPVKFNTGHFTKGTVVKCNTSPNSNVPDKVLTVHKLISNGPGSFCIEAEEVHPVDHSFAGERIGFNIEWVTEIICRPSGKAKVEEQHCVSSFNKATGKYVSFERFVMDFGNSVRQSKVDGCFINEEKLFKRLKQMGLIKHIAPVAGREEYNYIGVKRKEALKFLKKNPHWGFHTLEESRKIDEEYADTMMGDFDY